jgi:type II secretory pathway pseudopilin PulG
MLDRRKNPTSKNCPVPGPARPHGGAERGVGAESGFALVELLTVLVMMVLLMSATFAALNSTTKAQTRDQTYAQEVTSTQTAVARLVHDLRQATEVLFVTPSKIEFQMPPVGGTTYTVLYDCTASDSLGSAYTRCARTQTSSGSVPAAGSSPGPEDVQHIYNDAAHGFTTFCNASGTAPSGAVFFPTNNNFPDTDGSTAACDEAYEQEIGSLVDGPLYVQITVQVPASGTLKNSGTTHLTTITSGAFLPNLSSGA